MQIKIGYSKDEKNKVSKSFTIKHTYNNAKLKEDTSIVNPTIILGTVDDLADINYMYIPTFKRYYYVNNIVALTGSRIALECACDVLNSFKNDILKCKAIINKQQSSSLSSKYIDDNSYVTECRTVVQAKEFPHGFTSTANIIITAGG